MIDSEAMDSSSSVAVASRMMDSIGVPDHLAVGIELVMLFVEKAYSISSSSVSIA
jgi:hypothetical protein